MQRIYQKQFIKACGEHIKDVILEEVQKARFYSIIADEATDS